MAQVAFIASGTATLVAGTLVVGVPLITVTSIVLIGTGTTLGEAGAGVHLVSEIDVGAHTVTFTSVDGNGAIVNGDIYTFNYVILEGGNLDSDITGVIDTHKVYLEDAANAAVNTRYMNNLNAQKAADVAIEAVNVGAVAALGAAQAAQVVAAANAAAAQAAAALAAVNDPIQPGQQRAPFPYSTALVAGKALTLPLSRYTNEFFNYDAIGKNHDGVTTVDVPFGAGGGAPRTMTGFYNQITTGDPLAAAIFNAAVAGALQDALNYYIDDTNDDELKPYLRYKMPVYHFRAVVSRAITTAAHYVEILPTSRLPFFNFDGTLITDPNGVLGPIPNSYEAKSLQYDFSKGREQKIPGNEASKLIRRKENARFGKNDLKGWIYGAQPIIDAVAIAGVVGIVGQVPIRILPNFLHGCCIRTSEPTTELYRPLTNPEDSGYASLWCKVFPSETQPLNDKGVKGPGVRIPYNKDVIHITDGHYPVERWDGVVCFINEATGRYVDMPIGCVMIGDTAPLYNLTPDAQEWNTNFLPAITATRTLFLTAATAAAVLGEMFPGRRALMPNVFSYTMGLAMYVYNLRLIGITIASPRIRRVAISGGYTKKNITKKTRNMNKRQRQRRSKSKSMSMLKSAKRTFYRTNKQNKTSRQYH